MNQKPLDFADHFGHLKEVDNFISKNGMMNTKAEI